MEKKMENEMETGFGGNKASIMAIYGVASKELKLSYHIGYI